MMYLIENIFHMIFTLYVYYYDILIFYKNNSKENLILF